MSNGIVTRLKYKEALIVKHLLRDKQNKDADEIRLYGKVVKNIEGFREFYNISPKNE